MADYDQIKLLGKGAFGEAWLVREKKTDKELVLKKAHFEGTPGDAEQTMLMELQALTGVHHPNIVQFIRHVRLPGGMFGILMEYCSCGTLTNKIDENAARSVPFPDDVVIKWFGQLAGALQHVHDQNIVHRDLKPDNIFMATDRSVKIGDFGVATFVATRSAPIGRSAAGTYLYAAPEVFSDDEYTYRCDLWSLGVVMYEVIRLTRPFRTPAEVQNGDYDPLPNTVYKELRTLVHSLLQQDPKKRPRGEDILQNEIFQHANLTLTTYKKSSAAPSESSNLFGSVYSSSGAASTVKPDESKSKTAPPPPPTAEDLDLAFALDCTGSMQKYIDATRKGIRRIVGEIRDHDNCNLRLALVEYRDHPPEEETFVTKVFGFTEDESIIKTELESCAASGGGDTPEAVADAIHDLKNLRWRKDATKVAVMIVDAPPHGLKGFNFNDGFPDGCLCGYDPVKLCDELRENDIVLYFVGCEPNSAEYREVYDALAYKTGGRYLALKEEQQLINLIIASSLSALSITTLSKAVDSMALEMRKRGVDEETASRQVFEEVKASGSKLAVISAGGTRLPKVSEKSKQYMRCKTLSKLNEKIRELKDDDSEEPAPSGDARAEYRVVDADPSLDMVSELVTKSFRSKKK